MIMKINENKRIKFEIINDDFVNMLDDEDTEKLVKAIEYAIEYTLEMISFEAWTEECSIEYKDERSKKDEEHSWKNEEDDKEVIELGKKYMVKNIWKNTLTKRSSALGNAW